MTCYFDAVHELVGGQIGGPTHGPVSKYRFHDGQTPPSEEEIQTKLAELQAAEPMRLLRQERNIKLSETDWMSFSDSPTMTDAWRTYRQTLRDLPSTTEPKLDENGNLTNVTWPTKPT